MRMHLPGTPEASAVSRYSGASWICGGTTGPVGGRRREEASRRPVSRIATRLATEEIDDARTHHPKADEDDLGEFERKRSDDRKQAELLGRDAADQRHQTIFRDAIGRSTEILVALAHVVAEIAEQPVGHGLVAGDAFRVRQQVEAEIAVPPQRISI